MSKIKSNESLFGFQPATKGEQLFQHIGRQFIPAFFRIDVASTIFMLPAELVVPGLFACHKGTIGQPLQAPSYG